MKLFGTDGVRGVFGQPPLDEVTMGTLGYELGRHVRMALGRDPDFVLGGDTRESRDQLCRYLASGLRAAGANLRNAGMLPTPGVAWLVQDLELDGGIVLSASHNPWQDNGVKLIDRDGFKWSDAREAELESRIANSDFERGADEETVSALNASVADPAEEPALVQGYLDHLRSTLTDSRDFPLRGLEVVIDTANGAASPFAGPLFESLGAKVHVLFDRPDGRNINRDCGSTEPAIVAREVVGRGADMGIAFDGDADRVILCDDRGNVRDGDEILYLWATALAARGQLENRAIVATSMSNLGLSRALEEHGISLRYCDVGDRAVVSKLRSENLILGGEQSGHIVNMALATTGDGMLTGLHLAALVSEAKDRTSPRSLSDLLVEFRRFPQILINVEVREKPPLAGLPAVKSAIDAAQAELKDDGRLVLRFSGTEPKARVMIEGPDQEVIERHARSIARAIEETIGA